jgi:hypothetical protein
MKENDGAGIETAGRMEDSVHILPQKLFDFEI